MSAKLIRQRYYPNISEENFRQIASADPLTTNLEKDKLGMYAKWLLHIYNKQQLKFEDLYKAQEYIPIFDRLAKAGKISEKDIYRYASLAELYKEISPFVNNQPPLSQTEQRQIVKNQEADRLYEDDHFIVVYPRTQAASCLYGQGTQWCTAAKNYNAFHQYNSQGKLYIIIDKSRKLKYQFHFESKSFMNEHDEPLSNDLFGCINATDGLMRFFMRERPRRLFILNSLGYMKLHVVTQNGKYGLANVSGRRLQMVLQPNCEMIKIITAGLVEITNHAKKAIYNYYTNKLYDYNHSNIKVITSGIVEVAKLSGKAIYNCYTNKRYPLPLSSSGFILSQKFTLIPFLSKMFSVTTNDLLRYLKKETSRTLKAKMREQAPCNTIVANVYTANILSYFNSSDSFAPISPLSVIKKARNQKEALRKDGDIELLSGYLYRSLCNLDQLWLIINNQLEDHNFQLGRTEYFERQLA